MHYHAIAEYEMFHHLCITILKYLSFRIVMPSWKYLTLNSGAEIHDLQHIAETVQHIDVQFLKQFNRVIHNF